MDRLIEVLSHPYFIGLIHIVNTNEEYYILSIGMDDAPTVLEGTLKEVVYAARRVLRVA